jgi:DNA-binding response OmpR family regulator
LQAAANFLILTHSPDAGILPPHARSTSGNPGKDGKVENGRRVLVVDELTETTDVLRAVLEPRGVRVDGSARQPEGPTISGAGRVSVVVVDEETAEYRGVDRRDFGNTPRVIIGTVRLSEEQMGGVTGNPRERFLQKPFHYADLIREIETLIAADDE